MNATVPTTMRELHSRVNDGIHVRLLWAERDGRLAVTVTDTRTGEAFCIEIRDGENALEVFHHPYAYAAWHGIDTGVIRTPDEPEPEPDVSLAA
ncbi:MAG: hypothetical protein ACJ76X_08375 [Solirubrobacteraceae bacterium]|jgi:hypothetical protein